MAIAVDMLCVALIMKHTMSYCQNICCLLHGKRRLSSCTLLTRWRGCAVRVAKLIKILASNVTVRISAQNNKSFISVLEYKVVLNRRIKFVCVAVFFSDESLLT